MPDFAVLYSLTPSDLDDLTPREALAFLRDYRARMARQAEEAGP